MKRYDSYKDSGVEWIGQIPSNWKLLTNKYFTKSQKNKSETGQEELLSVSEHKGVIPRRKIREGEEHLTRSESLVGYLKVRKGELVSNIMLMWKRGLGVSEHEGIVSPSYSVFSFKKSEPKYFHYLYRTDQYVSEFRRNSTGVIESRLRLYDDSFGSLKSHFPPLNEQKQIVEYLDTKTELIDSLIEKTERKIELLKEKRTSIISETVTKGLNPNIEMKDSGVEWIGKIPSHWKKTKHKFNLSILSGYPFKSELFDKSEGFPLIRIRDISSGQIETYYKGEVLDKFVVDEGDLLVGMDGDFNTRWWNSEKGLLNQRCCSIIEGSDVLRRYLHYILPIELEIINDLTYYTTVKHLSVDDINNTDTILPPLNEQQQIVEYLDEQTQLIDKTISNEEKRIELLKEYRQSLISEVVTGKRKVTN